MNVENPLKPWRRRANVELIEKISALVPPPRINSIRYHGVFAPHAKDRDKIVPALKTNDNEQSSDNESPASYKYRLSFAALLARVFQIQIETCPHCGGPPSRSALWRDLRP
jgi:hypothetical protein